MFPLWLSLRVALVSILVVLPIGLTLAHLQSGRRYRGHGLVSALLLLPIVLPPTVIGFYLVWMFGRDGPLGRLVHALTGVYVPFTFWACVIAAGVVALPLLTRTAQAAFEGVDVAYEEIAATLGASPREAFFRVRLPLAAPGILAGTILAFSRALGEFGATMMLAGNVPGRTNTMPIEIYSAYVNGDDQRALAFVTLLTAVSIAVVVAAERLARGGR